MRSAYYSPGTYLASYIVNMYVYVMNIRSHARLYVHMR